MWIKTVLIALSVGIACGSVRRPPLIRVPRETPAYIYHQPSSDGHAAILGELTRVVSTDEQDHSRVLASGSATGSVVTSNQGPISAATSSQEPVSAVTSSQEPVFTVTSSQTISSALTSNHRAASTDPQAGGSHGPTTEWPVSQREILADIVDDSETSSTTAVNSQDSVSSSSPLEISTSHGPSDSTAGLRVSPSNRGLANTRFQTRLGIASEVVSTDKSDGSLSLGTLATEKVTDAVTHGGTGVDFNDGISFSKATGSVSATSRNSVRSAETPGARNLNEGSGAAVTGTFVAAQNPRSINFNEISTGAVRSESPITVTSSPSAAVFSQGSRLSDLLNIVFSAIGLFGLGAHERKQDFQILPNSTAVNRASNLEGSSDLEKILILSEAFSPAGLSPSAITVPAGSKGNKNTDSTDTNSKSSEGGFGNGRPSLEGNFHFHGQGGLHSVSATAINHNTSEDIETSRATLSSTESGAIQLTTDSVSDNIDSATKVNHISVNPNLFSSTREQGSTTSGSFSGGAIKNSDISRGATAPTDFTATPKVTLPPIELSGANSATFSSGNVEREFTFKKSPHIPQGEANVVPSSLSTDSLSAESASFSSNRDKGFHLISVTSLTPSSKGSIVVDKISSGTKDSGTTHIITGSESEGSNLETKFMHDGISRRVLFNSQSQGHDTLVNSSESLPADFDVTQRVPVPSALAATSTVATLPTITNAATFARFSDGEIENKLHINKGDQRVQEAVEPAVISHTTDSLPDESISLESNRNKGLHIVSGATMLTGDSSFHHSSAPKLSHIGKTGARFLSGTQTSESAAPTSTFVGASANNNVSQGTPGAKLLSAASVTESGATLLTRDSAARASQIGIGSRLLSNRRTPGNAASTNNSVGVSTNRNGSQRTLVAKDFSATSTKESGSTQGTRDSTSDLNQSAPTFRRLGVGSGLLSNRRAPGSSASNSKTVDSSVISNNGERVSAAKSFTASSTTASRAKQLTSESAAKVRGTGIRSRLFSNRRVPGSTTLDSISAGATANSNVGNRVPAGKALAAGSAESATGQLTSGTTFDIKNSATNFGHSGIRSRLLTNRRAPGIANFARKPASSSTNSNNRQRASANTLPRVPLVANTDRLSETKVDNEFVVNRGRQLVKQAGNHSESSHSLDSSGTEGISLQPQEVDGFHSFSVTAIRPNLNGDIQNSKAALTTSESGTAPLTGNFTSNVKSSVAQLNRMDAGSRIFFNRRPPGSATSSSNSVVASANSNINQRIPVTEGFVDTFAAASGPSVSQVIKSEDFLKEENTLLAPKTHHITQQTASQDAPSGSRVPTAAERDSLNINGGNTLHSSSVNFLNQNSAGDGIFSQVFSGAVESTPEFNHISSNSRVFADRRLQDSALSASPSQQPITSSGPFSSVTETNEFVTSEGGHISHQAEKNAPISLTSKGSLRDSSIDGISSGTVRVSTGAGSIILPSELIGKETLDPQDFNSVPQSGQTSVIKHFVPESDNNFRDGDLKSNINAGPIIEALSESSTFRPGTSVTPDSSPKVVGDAHKTSGSISHSPERKTIKSHSDNLSHGNFGIVSSQNSAGGFRVAEGAASESSLSPLSVSEVNGVTIGPDAASIHRTLFSASPSLPKGAVTDATLNQGTPMALFFAASQAALGAEQTTNEKAHSLGSANEQNLALPGGLESSSSISAGITGTTVIAEPSVLRGTQGIGSEAQDPTISSSAKLDSGVEQFIIVSHNTNAKTGEDIQGVLSTSSTSAILSEDPSLQSNFHKQESVGATGFSNRPTTLTGDVIQTAIGDAASNAERILGSSQNDLAVDIQFIKSIPSANPSPLSSTTGLNAVTTGLISGFNKQLSSSSASAGSPLGDFLQRNINRGKPVAQTLSSVSTGTPRDATFPAVTIGSVGNINGKGTSLSVKGSAESPNTAGVSGSSGNAAKAHFLNRNAEIGSIISRVHDGPSAIFPSTSGSVRKSPDQTGTVQTHAASLNNLNQPTQIAHGSTIHSEPSFILIVEDSSAALAGTTETAERLSERKNNALKSQVVSHDIPSRFSSRAGIASSSSNVVSNTEAANSHGNIKEGESITRGAHSTISEPASLSAGLSATSRITGRPNKALPSPDSPKSSIAQSPVTNSAQQSLQRPVQPRIPTAVSVSTNNNRPIVTSSLSGSRFPVGSQSASSAILNHKPRELGAIAQDSPGFGFHSAASTTRLHSSAGGLGSNNANVRISSTVQQGSDALQGTTNFANASPIRPQIKNIIISSLENSGLFDSGKDTDSNGENSSSAGQGVFNSHAIPNVSNRNSILSNSVRNQEAANAVQTTDFSSQNFVAGTVHSGANTRDNTKLGSKSEGNSALLGTSPSTTSFTSNSNNIKSFPISTSSKTLLTAHTTGAVQARQVTVSEPSFSFTAEDPQATLHSGSHSNIDGSSRLSKNSVRDQTTHSVSSNHRTAGEESLDFTRTLSTLSTGDSSQIRANIASSLLTHATKSPNAAEASRVNEPTFAALVGNPETTSHNAHAVLSSARAPSDLRSSPRPQIDHFTIANHKFLGAARIGQGATTVISGFSSPDSSTNESTFKRKEQLDVSSISSSSSSITADSSEPSAVRVSGENSFSQRRGSAELSELKTHNALQGLNTDNAGERQHGNGLSSTFSNARNAVQLPTVTSGSQFQGSLLQDSGATVVSHGTDASAGARVISRNPDSSGVTHKFASSERARLGSGVSSLGTFDASPASTTVSIGNTASNFGRVSTGTGTISGSSSANLLAGSSGTQLNRRPSNGNSSQRISTGEIIFSLGNTPSNSFNQKADVVSRLGLPVSITNIQRKDSSSTAFPKSEGSLAANTRIPVSTNSQIVLPSPHTAISKQSKFIAQEGIDGHAVKSAATLSGSGGLNLSPLARSSGKLSLGSQGSNTAIDSTGSKSVTATSNNHGIILVGDVRRSSPQTSATGNGGSAELHKLSNDNSGIDSASFSVTHGSGFSQRALNIGPSQNSGHSGISSNAALAATDSSDSTKSRDILGASIGKGTPRKIITSESSSSGLSPSASERTSSSSFASVTSSADRTLTVVSNKPEIFSQQSPQTTSVSPSSSSFTRVNSGSDGASRDVNKSFVAQRVPAGVHRQTANDEAQRKPLPSDKGPDVILSAGKTAERLTTGVSRFTTSVNVPESSVSSAGSSVSVPSKSSNNQNVHEKSKSRGTSEAAASAKTDGIGSIVALGTHIDNSHIGSLVRMQASIPKFNGPVAASGLSSLNGQDTASVSFPARAQGTVGGSGESSSAISNNSFGGSRAGAASRTVGNTEETGDRKGLVSTSDISSSQTSAATDDRSTDLASTGRSRILVSGQDNPQSNSFSTSRGTASGNLESHHLSQGGSEFTSLFGNINSPIAAKIGVPVKIPASFLSARSRTS